MTRRGIGATCVYIGAGFGDNGAVLGFSWIPARGGAGRLGLSERDAVGNARADADAGAGATVGERAEAGTWMNGGNTTCGVRYRISVVPPGGATRDER